MRLLFSTRSLIGITLILLTGCYYDKESILYPGGSTCVAVANPTYSVDVVPILDLKCNSCHSGTSPSAGIKLDSYVEVSKSVKNGSLMGSMNYSSGYSPMPKNSSKMPACEIQKIQDWITQGALNN